LLGSAAYSAKNIVYSCRSSFIYTGKSHIKYSFTKSIKIIVNVAYPIKFSRAALNHSKLVDGTMLPKAAPEKVVIIKNNES